MSMWISFVGGKLNVYSASHELQSASEKRVPRPRIQSAPRHLLVDELRAPEPRHAEHERMVVGQRALAHQRVRDGKRQVIDELAQLGRGVGEHDAAADVEQRALRAEQRPDDLLGRLLVERRLVQRLGVVPQALEQRDVDLLREDVHRHVDQHRPRPAALGERERLLDDLGEQVRPSPRARRA